MNPSSDRDRVSRRRCWLRRFLWTTLIVGTFISLLYAIENWRGARAWDQAKRDFEASGGTLDWGKLFPGKLFPDEQNFGAIPLLEGITTPEKFGDHSNTVRAALAGPEFRQSKEIREAMERSHYTTCFETGQPIDYEALREAFGERFVMPEEEPDPARAILHALEAEIGWVKDLDTATKRPMAQLLPPGGTYLDPDQPWHLGQPHIGVSRNLVVWLGRRATAAIGCGDTEVARKSLTSAFRLAHAMGTEPVLICQLVLNTQLSMLQTPLWEGLHRKLWDEKALAWLEYELNHFDLAKTFRAITATEIAWTSSVLDFFKSCSATEMTQLMGLQAQDNKGLAPSERALLMQLMPNGWFDRTKASSLMRLKSLQDALVTGDFSLAKAATEKAARHQTLIESWIPLATFDQAIRSVAWIQTRLQLTRLAIGLERHSLKHGRYPDKLDALASDFFSSLPADPMGDAWRYTCHASGNVYELYSIGWNLIDDGGQPATLKGSDHGDWVWVR